jgi:protein-S-isoprenylcysteine O-methyltransferase Ste14
VAWGAGRLVPAAGLARSGQAMAVNPFLEGAVRVQRERGQRVIEAGPHRRVPHPGQLGLALLAVPSSLLPGSLAAWGGVS